MILRQGWCRQLGCYSLCFKKHILCFSLYFCCSDFAGYYVSFRSKKIFGFNITSQSGGRWMALGLFSFRLCRDSGSAKWSFQNIRRKKSSGQRRLLSYLLLVQEVFNIYIFVFFNKWKSNYFKISHPIIHKTKSSSLNRSISWLIFVCMIS